MAQRIDDLLEVALKRKEMQLEHQINYFRFIIFSSATLIDFIIIYLSGEKISLFLVLLAILFIPYLFIIHLLTSGKRYRPYIKYITISTDFLVYFLVIKEYQVLNLLNFTSSQENGAILIGFFVVLIILGALRFSQRAILFSGFLALVGGIWVALAIAQSVLLLIYSVFTIVATIILIYYFSSSFRNMFIKLSQREALARFLPNEMVESIEKGEIALSLGGEEKLVTILLSDIRGFSTLAEDMEPSELVEWLNEYLSRMTEIIFEFGGIIDKFIGDAVMAVFGTPVSRRDDPERALLAALKMHNVVKDLNQELRATGRPPVKIGIAVHTGVVVAGNIGSPQRMEYTVIGDHVNVVARVEELNKKYNTNILLTDECYKRVKNLFEGDIVGETTVRGRKKPLKLYSLIGTK
jgi:class 3 adenylate cyclase